MTVISSAKDGKADQPATIEVTRPNSRKRGRSSGGGDGERGLGDGERLVDRGPSAAVRTCSSPLSARLRPRRRRGWVGEGGVVGSAAAARD